MIGELKTGKLLSGFRGAKPCDVAAPSLMRSCAWPRLERRSPTGWSRPRSILLSFYRRARARVRSTASSFCAEARSVCSVALVAKCRSSLSAVSIRWDRHRPSATHESSVPGWALVQPRKNAVVALESLGLASVSIGAIRNKPEGVAAELGLGLIAVGTAGSGPPTHSPNRATGGSALQAIFARGRARCASHLYTMPRFYNAALRGFQTRTGADAASVAPPGNRPRQKPGNPAGGATDCVKRSRVSGSAFDDGISEPLRCARTSMAPRPQSIDNAAVRRPQNAGFRTRPGAALVRVLRRPRSRMPRTSLPTPAGILRQSRSVPSLDQVSGPRRPDGVLDRPKQMVSP